MDIIGIIQMYNFQESAKGGWFEIVQEKFLKELRLNYKWKVEYGNRSGAAIIANKLPEESWDMNKIYQDTILMAKELEVSTEAIRNLKNLAFKRNKKTRAQSKVFEKRKDYKGLKAWMFLSLIRSMK